MAVFIDGLNMRNRLRESGWPELIDVRHLCERLAGNRELVACYFCIGAPNIQHLGKKRYWREIGYLRALEAQKGVTVEYGYMVKRNHRWQEKKVDSLITTKMTIGAATDEYDTAVLITADGDIVPPVEAVVKIGKRVETLVFTKAQAYVGQLVAVSTVQRNARQSHFIALPFTTPTS